MQDNDTVLMRHPDLDAEADRDPTETTVGAFRDCWSKLGWELAPENYQDATGEGETDPVEAELAKIAHLREQGADVVGAAKPVTPEQEKAAKADKKEQGVLTNG